MATLLPKGHPNTAGELPPGGQQPNNFPKQQNPNAASYIVGASEFGGPGDPTTPGDTGSCNKHMSGKHAFAELMMGTGLGGLPCGTKLKIEAIGSSHNAPVVAERLDIGLGGAPVSGHARRVDLWWETARAIGFHGTGLVRISRVDGKPILGPGDKKSGPEESEAKSAGINIPGLGEWAKELGKILSFLASSSGWLRIGKVVLGVGLLAIALSELTKISPDVPTVNAVGAAKKVVS